MLGQLRGALLSWRSPVSVPSVLIIEKSLLAIILSEVFEEAGYFVCLATNVDEAVGQLSRVDIDLLVADEKLCRPQNGFALVSWARKHSPRTKIILASDNSSDEDMPVAHEFDAFIAKVLMPERLLPIAQLLLQPRIPAANDRRGPAEESADWASRIAM